jgi:hypothetical protein
MDCISPGSGVPSRIGWVGVGVNVGIGVGVGVGVGMGVDVRVALGTSVILCLIVGTKVGVSVASGVGPEHAAKLNARQLIISFKHVLFIVYTGYKKQPIRQDANDDLQRTTIPEGYNQLSAGLHH